MRPENVVILRQRAEEARKFPVFFANAWHCVGCNEVLPKDNLTQWCDACWEKLSADLVEVI